MSSNVRKDSEVYPVEAADLNVVSNDHVGDAYWHMRLHASAVQTAATPGQFFHLDCPASDAGDPFLRRPMSVYSIDPVAGEISFLYKVTGAGTTGLSLIRPGETLNVLGPLGVGFTVDASHDHALILARGVGLATMAPLAERLGDAGVAVTTIASSRNPHAAIGLDAFRPYGDVVCVYDADHSSQVDAVEALIERIHDARQINATYTCGSRRLANLLRGLTAMHGFQSEIALEQQMACALGMCHACVVDLRVADEVASVRVCTAGPVFDLMETT